MSVRQHCNAEAVWRDSYVSCLSICCIAFWFASHHMHISTSVAQCINAVCVSSDAMLLVHAEAVHVFGGAV